MNHSIKIGFSMHPRWAGKRGLAAFVEPLRQAGLTSLEMELDDRLADWAEFPPLMTEAAAMGLDLTFHAPYRAPHNLAGFSSGRRQEVMQEYEPMLAIAESWAERLGSRRSVVVHGAYALLPAERQPLLEDTRAFLEWAVGRFSGLLFALENNSPARPSELKIGERYAGVLEALEPLEALNHERLKVCWDMGHAYRTEGAALPPPEWLARVAHVHVHDVNDAGEDHCPLIYGRVPWPAWLKELEAAGMHGTVVMELMGARLMGWPPEKILGALVDSVALLAKEIG